MAIKYIKGIQKAIREYQRYLPNPTNKKHQTTKERAQQKAEDIKNFINNELQSQFPRLFHCPYLNFRGGDKNRRMLKYHDKLTPNTKWCISVDKEGEDWIIYGIEQEKVLALRDIHENRIMLSLKDYILENMN